MNENELLCGIYVYFNCFDGSKIIVKVTGFNDGIVYGVSEQGTHWCNISKVEPIALTVEILVKNGFEVQEQGGGRQDVWNGFGKDNENDIEVEFNGGALVYVKIDGYGCYFTSGKIHYVHELQNALKLCKIEKEIIL